MSGINVRRVLIGGLIAGLVDNAFGFVISRYLMASEFAAMRARLNVDRAPAPSHSWPAIFLVMNVVWGVMLVFTYAAMRPRFGAGPKTAVVAGVLLWLGLAFEATYLLASGLHTPQSYVKSGLLYLVAAIASSLAGAALYKEQSLEHAG